MNLILNNMVYEERTGRCFGADGVAKRFRFIAHPNCLHPENLPFVYTYVARAALAEYGGGDSKLKLVPDQGYVAECSYDGQVAVVNLGVFASDWNAQGEDIANKNLKNVLHTAQRPA